MLVDNLSYVDGMLSLDGVARKMSHSNLNNLLLNSHPQYLEENTEIFNDYATATIDKFLCRERDSGRKIQIAGITSQNINEVVFELSRNPIGLVDIITTYNNGIKWTKLTAVGNALTINQGNQAIIYASNTLYQDDDGAGHTNPVVNDMNSAVNDSFDRVKNATDVIGMVDENTTTMDYTSNNILVDDENVKEGLEKFDVVVGDRLYTYNEVLTDGETVTASFNALDGFIHEEYYAEESGYQAYQDTLKSSGVSVYSITQDENATTPLLVSDFSKIVNNPDLFSITDSDFKPIYKQGSVFKTASNLVKVSSYNSTTGEITLNFEPKINFRVNYTLKYNRKNVPDGKLQLASNIQNIIERDENEEEDLLQFNTGIANPIHSEGALFYDNAKKTLSYYNENSEVTVDIGRDSLIRVINNTGSTIYKGSAVCPVGVSGELPSIALATATEEAKSKVVGIATTDITDGNTGDVTKFGEVGGINTIGFSSGDLVYLSDTAGELTIVKPKNGSFVTTMGIVEVSHLTDGKIMVDIISSQLASEVTNTNGFPHNRDLGNSLDAQTNTTLDFNEATRVFEISPISGSFRFYEQGVQYLKNSTQSVTIPETEGLFILYFKDGVLTQEPITASSQVEPIILKYCIVSYIYWDNSNKKAVYFGEERHGMGMSPETHAYLHQTRGAQFIAGLGVGDITADGDGDLNIDAQFSVSGGSIRDEDIVNTITGITSTVGTPIYYLEGNNLKRYAINPNFSVLTTGTGRIAYNENVGGVWQLTEVNNRDFVLYHVFAVSNYEEEFKIVTVVGQNEYPDVGTARAGASSEIASLTSTLLTAETVPIATIIYQTRDSYGNDVKGRIRTTDTGEDYIDWRDTELAMGSPANSHNNLSNLQLAGDTITWGHINDNGQDIYGEKTFVEGLQVVSTVDTFNIETKTLDTFLYSSYKSSIYDYEVSNGANLRVGVVKVLSNGITANVSDTSDVEFGDTLPVVFDGNYSGGNVSLTVTSTTSGWSIKFKKKYM